MPKREDYEQAIQQIEVAYYNNDNSYGAMRAFSRNIEMLYGLLNRCFENTGEKSMNKYNVFNVGFINDKGQTDETQFDIPTEKDEKAAHKELIELFSEFCKENNIQHATIIYMNLVKEEVQHDD